MPQAAKKKHSDSKKHAPVLIYEICTWVRNRFWSWIESNVWKSCACQTEWPSQRNKKFCAGLDRSILQERYEAGQGRSERAKEHVWPCRHSSPGLHVIKNCGRRAAWWLSSWHANKTVNILLKTCYTQGLLQCNTLCAVISAGSSLQYHNLRLSGKTSLAPESNPTWKITVFCALLARNWWERARQQFPSCNLWKIWRYILFKFARIRNWVTHTLGSWGRWEHAKCS